MNLQFLIEKLEASEEFKNFMKENPKAYACSGFFVIDLEKGNDNKSHIDYYVPSSKEIFSFQLEDGVKKIPVDIIDERVPEKVSLNYDINFDDVQKLIADELEKQNVKNKIQKILLSLQSLDGKEYFLGTVFISSLGIIKIEIDIDKKEITNFERKSFLDMMKVLKK